MWSNFDCPCLGLSESPADNETSCSKTKVFESAQKGLLLVRDPEKKGAKKQTRLDSTFLIYDYDFKVWTNPSGMALKFEQDCWETVWL